LEAQACENIIIATNIGESSHLIIDEDNGYLINPNEQELMIRLDKANTHREFLKMPLL
jgi:glycosyltransferase involved in cell wall biosynthesis